MSIPEERERERTDVITGIVKPAGAGVPRISVVSGPSAGRAIAIVRSTVTVGRHSTNDLVVLDPGVSGVHLELRPAGARVAVRDAGSTNGIWFGPHRVSQIELASGGEFVIGSSTLRIDLDEDSSPAAVSPETRYGELVGESTAMREIFAVLERVSSKNLNLLFQGEAGTGKEEMARAVASRSLRSAGPFFVVDATSLNDAFGDAVLFGRQGSPRAGSSAGDGTREKGIFEAADGGTVFLDEVGELSLPLQSKLLRVLERQELVPAGGFAPTKVDVRVLASTTRDLRHDIEQGRFREDLYLRLAQIRIYVPPLRERIGDLPILCRKFLVTASSASSAPSLELAEDTLKRLAEQPWPGNVRELRNALERAAALATGGVIGPNDVAGEGAGFRGTPEERAALDLSGTFKQAKEKAIERFESAFFAALMRRCNGNLSMAAREADVARHYLRDRLKKRELYGVSWDASDE